MKNFVADRGRSGSPQSRGSARPPTRGEQRAKLADQARVQTKGAALLHRQPGQQNSSARRQSGSTVNLQAPQQQPPPQRRAGDSAGLQHDRYDTDAESLDTTIHGHSQLQVADSQAFAQQHNPGANTDYSGSDDESGEDFEDELPDGQLEEQRDDQSDRQATWDSLVKQYHMAHMDHATQLDFLKHNGVEGWDDGNSYPTTTSGPPDGFPDNWTIEQDAPSEGNRQRSSPSPVRRSTAALFARPPIQQPVARSQQAAVAQQKMPKQTSIYQQGAQFRQDRAAANVSAHNVPRPSTQPPTFSQAPPEPIPLTKPAPHQATSVQANPFIQHDARQPSGLARSQPFQQPLVHHGRPLEPAAPLIQPAPPQLKVEESSAVHKPVTQDPIVELPRGPVEDYDQPNLFRKNFDELKAEDFDTVPRGQPQVLSDDMVQKPLEERLEHVGKHLDAGDQDKFFRGLRTNEWEEAGDWFLTQFSDIITRTKQARQKKRKLAAEFEDEIEKRYRYVAKRQQHVEGAMSKMKAQGEGLMPKSPRPSKSPRKT